MRFPIPLLGGKISTLIQVENIDLNYVPNVENPIATAFTPP